MVPKTDEEGGAAELASTTMEEAIRFEKTGFETEGAAFLCR